MIVRWSGEAMKARCSDDSDPPAPTFSPIRRQFLTLS